MRPDPGSGPGSDTGPAGRLARHLGGLLGSGVRELARIGGQHGVSHYRVVLADGRTVFAKVAAGEFAGDTDLAAPDGPAGSAGSAGSAARGAGFAAEANGLRWLGEAGAVPVPEVLGWDDRALVIAWVPQERADRRSAENLGRELAGLHAAGSASFGAPWPGDIASLPLDNTPAGSWPQWYASRRLLPYARRARDAGSLSAADIALVEAVADQAAALGGPAEPPSRIHGDCWSGNVLWSGGRGVLIDPAAHGGHRETDLAMLALFGVPYLDRILAAYQEAAPLAAGWPERVPLHQLHPLLVHACLFGPVYRDPVLTAARAALSG
jgi:fructosamine-3-kinase